MNKLLSGDTIVQGGVLPNIQAVHLSKMTVITIVESYETSLTKQA